MNEALVLTAEGHRAPPAHFVRLLEAYDRNLRVVWGFGQAVPFPGWVIERRIPAEMKAKVYADGPGKPANRQRYSYQVITDEHGEVAMRTYDMMPDWHPIYRVMNAEGQPILELGEFVIDYLRRNYERTLLGFPELGARHLAEDREAKRLADEKVRERTLEDAAKDVMDHKFQIFGDVMAFGGQPRKVKEGTEIQ